MPAQKSGLQKASLDKSQQVFLKYKLLSRINEKKKKRRED